MPPDAYSLTPVDHDPFASVPEGVDPKTWAIWNSSVDPAIIRQRQLEQIIGPGVAEGEVLPERHDLGGVRDYHMPVVTPQEMPGRIIDPYSLGVMAVDHDPFAQETVT